MLIARGQGSTFVELSSEGLASTPLHHPPLSDQRAIADLLDAETARIDSLIAKKRRMIELSRERYSVARFKRIQCPQGASLIPLRRLVVAAVGGAWGGEPGSDEVDVRCVRVADFDRATAHTADLIPTIRSLPTEQARRLELRVGDLLLEKSGGGDKQPVGFVAGFRGHDGPTVCSNFVARMRPAAGFAPSYLRHLFAALYDQGMSIPHIKQTTGIQNLDVRSFLQQKWRVPDLETQQGVAATLDELMRSAHKLQMMLERQIALLDEHRRALVTAAVTGHIELASAG